MSPSANDLIQAECDESHSYLSNGNDGYCLVGGSQSNFEVLDCVGDWNGDPGAGWDVAGISDATKDHTLVRKVLTHPQVMMVIGNFLLVNLKMIQSGSSLIKMIGLT